MNIYGNIESRARSAARHAKSGMGLQVFVIDVLLREI
jgi:hypothetical protein|tara:strand:- start:5131 stop:5241 length:111 start_codon:yes stop_codon:yes gene_type:complete